jgi:hypothetical protein
MKKTINCIIISKDWVTGFLGLEYKKVTGGPPPVLKYIFAYLFYLITMIRETFAYRMIRSQSTFPFIILRLLYIIDSGAYFIFSSASPGSAEGTPYGF